MTFFLKEFLQYLYQFQELEQAVFVSVEAQSLQNQINALSAKPAVEKQMRTSLRLLTTEGTQM